MSHFHPSDAIRRSCTCSWERDLYVGLSCQVRANASSSTRYVMCTSAPCSSFRVVNSTLPQTTQKLKSYVLIWPPSFPMNIQCMFNQPAIADGLYQTHQEARINVVPNILQVVNFTNKDIDFLCMEGINLTLTMSPYQRM